MNKRGQREVKLSYLIGGTIGLIILIVILLNFFGVFNIAFFEFLPSFNDTKPITDTGGVKFVRYRIPDSSLGVWDGNSWIGCPEKIEVGDRIFKCSGLPLEDDHLWNSLTSYFYKHIFLDLPKEVSPGLFVHYMENGGLYGDFVDENGDKLGLRGYVRFDYSGSSYILNYDDSLYKMAHDKKEDIGDVKKVIDLGDLKDLSWEMPVSVYKALKAISGTVSASNSPEGYYWNALPEHTYGVPAWELLDEEGDISTGVLWIRDGSFSYDDIYVERTFESDWEPSINEKVTSWRDSVFDSPWMFMATDFGGNEEVLYYCINDGIYGSLIVDLSKPVAQGSSCSKSERRAVSP